MIVVKMKTAEEKYNHLMESLGLGDAKCVMPNSTSQELD
jgi:hypothetical protein